MADHRIAEKYSRLQYVAGHCGIRFLKRQQPFSASVSLAIDDHGPPSLHGLYISRLCQQFHRPAHSLLRRFEFQAQVCPGGQFRPIGEQPAFYFISQDLIDPLIYNRTILHRSTCLFNHYNLTRQISQDSFPLKS